MKPNQKMYLSLLCIPIPSSSSIIDTHTHKQSKYYYDIKPMQHHPNMIPFLTRMYTQCRDLFAFRVCWVSLSPPLVVDVWILFSPVYTAICFFLSDDESVGQTFFLNSTEVIYYIHHSTQCTLHVGLTFVGSRKQLKL